MIEQSLFQSNFLGRDGFKWWIGQVADPETSGWDKTATLIEKEDCHYYRVKVRILGYHPTRDKLSDRDLPWAHVLVPLGQGTFVNNIGETHDIQGGESVIGFFADGDDCQQPIVFGAFYRQRDQSNETFATGEDPSDTFKRFSGRKRTKNHDLHLKEKTDPNGGTNVSTGVASTTRTPQEQPPGAPVKVTAALASHSLISNKTLNPPNPCASNNDIARIRTFLVEFMNKMRQIQFFLNSYVNPALNKLVNLDDEILRFTKLILGVVSGQIAKLRDFIMKTVGNAINTILASLIPKSLQPITGEASKTILDLIFCLLEQLIRYLFDLIRGLLEDLLNRLFDVVECTVDNILYSIFDAIENFVNQNISPLLNQINSVLGGALGSVGNIVSQALGYAGLALDLITKCDSSCPTPSVWTASGGLSFGYEDDFAALIDRLGGRDFGPCDNSLICATTITISGGGGNGAFADPIVSNGQIIGVNLIDGGSGYITTPTVSVQDNCGGYGGELTAIIDDGEVIEIIVDEPGDDYTDGGTRNSSGIFMGDLSGNTSENGTSATFKVCLLTQPTRDVTVNLTVDDTTEGSINRSQLTFTTSNWNVKQTITVTGLNDSIVDGDITYRIGALSSSRQPLYNSRTAEIFITNLDNDGGSGDGTTTPPRDSIDPRTGCGFIAGVIVRSIGSNYSPTDTVVALDRNGNVIPEIRIDLVIGPNNSIIAAEVRSSAIICGYLPELVINSRTGSGADLRASMRYQGITPRDPERIQKISIVDCVSK